MHGLSPAMDDLSLHPHPLLPIYPHPLSTRCTLPHPCIPLPVCTMGAPRIPQQSPLPCRANHGDLLLKPPGSSFPQSTFPTSSRNESPKGSFLPEPPQFPASHPYPLCIPHHSSPQQHPSQLPPAHIGFRLPQMCSPSLSCQRNISGGGQIDPQTSPSTQSGFSNSKWIPEPLQSPLHLLNINENEPENQVAFEGVVLRRCNMHTLIYAYIRIYLHLLSQCLESQRCFQATGSCSWIASGLCNILPPLSAMSQTPLPFRLCLGESWREKAQSRVCPRICPSVLPPSTPPNTPMALHIPRQQTGGSWGRWEEEGG